MFHQLLIQRTLRTSFGRSSDDERTNWSQYKVLRSASHFFQFPNAQPQVISIEYCVFKLTHSFSWNRNKIHTFSGEGDKHKPHTVKYDPHITVNFPALDRRAHIYLGPENEKDHKKMKIWRRQGKPAVVLCWCRLCCLYSGLSECERDISSRSLLLQNSRRFKKLTNSLYAFSEPQIS